MTLLQELTTLLKQKRELQDIAESVVQTTLEEQLRKNKLSTTANLTAKEKKILVKEARAVLRQSAGQYHAPLSKAATVPELLKSHTSTRERQALYPLLKRKIHELKVTSVLDLGCGLNPLALAEPSVRYYAADIRQDDLARVDAFFKKHNIKGKAFVYDAKRIDTSLPPVDLCLLMQLVDVLEKRGHKLAEKILTTVSARYFCISFATKTISGRPMNHPQRGWIERLLLRLGYPFECIKTKKEIFYFAEKPKVISPQSR